MIFVKFYPNPNDYKIIPEERVRIRKIIDDILLDLEKNYKVVYEERFNGLNSGGQYYELENIALDSLTGYLFDLEPVYIIQKKSMEFQGNIFVDALLIRLG